MRFPLLNVLFGGSFEGEWEVREEREREGKGEEVAVVVVGGRRSRGKRLWSPVVERRTEKKREKKNI